MQAIVAIMLFGGLALFVVLEFGIWTAIGALVIWFLIQAAKGE